MTHAANTWLRKLPTGVALAQVAPNEYQIGFPPHADFSGSEFENVQINNGNLHIEIPLWSTGGRGPSVGFKYVYDSLGWGFREQCSRLGGTCTDYVTPNPSHVGGCCSMGNHLMFTLVGPQSYQFSETTQYLTCPAGKVFQHSYNMSAPDGTKHHFVPDPVSYDPSSCLPSPGTLDTDDGSGWTLKVDTSNGNVLKAVRKDGMVIAGNTVEDTNGNEVNTPITPPYTDTLGRQFNNDGSYYDSNGALHTIPVVRQNVAIQTHLCAFSGADYCNEFSGTWGVPQTITLPNGMTYAFSYDQGSPTHPYYGQPLSVTLPTGGQITWGWSGERESGPNLVSRQLQGDPGPWKYSTSHVVTDPAGNDTINTCANYPPPYQSTYVKFVGNTCYIITKQYYQGSSASGTLIKTVQTDYQVADALPILPIHETTTWNQQNLVSRTETDYDSYLAPDGYWGTMSASNPVEKREFDYGTGIWGARIRTTDYGYLHLSNSTYRGLNILDKMTSKKVYSGSSQSGTLVAQTLNTYDGVLITGNGDTSGNPAPNHDYTNFSKLNNLRGNLTQASRGLRSGSGNWTWLSTNNTYNDLGEILTSTDPLGHQASYDYADNWATINNPQCVTSAHSYGFPTTITDPLGHRLKHQYFSCTSFVGSEQNENDIQASRPGTTYAYDFMGRLATKSLPDGGSATYTPNDTSLPYSVMQSTLVDPNSSLYMVGTTVFDGLGRVQQAQKHDPDCTAGLVKVDRAYGYGTQGRTTQVSTPYCNAPGGNYGLMTTTSFDALDRPVSVQQSDGSTATTSYAGNCQTGTDEAGKSRKSCFDALGRLTQVWEDPGTAPHLNYETDYGYDVLDNVTAATQKGGAGSSSWRARSFTYDSLSRLTCAANPEVTSGLGTVNPASCPATYSGTYTAGTIGYTYDSDSKVATEIAPAPNQTGTATVTKTYSYNPDHQLTGVTYSDGTTPSAQFGYNGTPLTSCTTTPPTLADNNPVHTRTQMCDGSGATSWAHDEMGRVLTEQRTIIGTSALTKTILYFYYKDGELNFFFYPNSKSQVTYTVNGSGGYTAGRPVSAVDTTYSINHVTGATYAPQGALASMTIGGSVNGAETYNARLQPLQMYYTAGTISPTTLNQLQQAACPTTTATIMSRSYQFGQGSNDNGTVQSITNCRDANRTQNFVYDSLNRVQQAYTSGPNWGETFGSAAAPGVVPSTPGIDAWGNLWQRSAVTGKTSYEPLNCPANTKNQLTTCSIGYDSAGNMASYGTATYTYDAENRLTSTGGVTYTYDGDGKRVKKSNGMLYWTGTASDALMETDLSGNPTAEYVFFGGRRIARIDRPANSAEYYYSDHLGSADVVTNATGGIVKESDYYPYGGEIPVITGDSNRYKFNGKERDTESNLDNFGARYNASSLGRFMTPDWAARPTAVPYAVFGDPQSLNLYGYVRNDPVSRADADGHTDAIQPKCPTKNCGGAPSSGSTGLSAAMAEGEMKKQGEAQKQSFWQKLASVFYVKASVGVSVEVGAEVHAGRAKRPAKVGFKVGADVKSTMTVTTKGASISATKEVQAGLNAGKHIVGPQTSTEDVTVKNGEPLANHEIEKSSSWLWGTEKAEATVSKGAVGVGAEVDAAVLVVGFEAGVDVDKLVGLFKPEQ